MNRKYAIAALALSVAGTVCAQSQTSQDTTKVNEMHQLTVSAVRAPKYAPFAVTNVSGSTLQQFGRTGQELPMLFSRTPGVMAWSENGLGTGTVYMSMRGSAASRVNITLDGVPLNSPEDQCVFWANMNSYASLLGSAQIQRGVGSSTNGDGAFGGSVALNTKAPALAPSLELTGNYGSYNTYNVGGNFSSGLLCNHWVIDGAYHHTGTDGYVHGTAGNSGSFYGGLTWMNSDRNVVISYKNIGNYEHTGQAWNGVTTGDNDNTLLEGSNLNWNTWPATIYPTGISSYKDMYRAGLGRFNSLYERLVPMDGANSFADANGNYVTERYQMADGSLWGRTTDNFNQDHNLFSVSWNIDEHWTTSGTLHYTYGYGYYDEFRPDNKLKKFGLANYTLADGSTLKKTDFVRQKGLEQNTYGLVWNARYTDNRWDVLAGLSAQQFQGNHFGRLTYIKNQELSDALLRNGRYTYYDSDATKDDFSTYLKATYHITPWLSAFGDLQYRYVRYFTNGINDKFYANADGTYTNQQLHIKQQYNFLNPKAGLSFHRGGHQAYASWAMGNREPERNNFTDNGSTLLPQAERVNDFEAGYSYRGSNWYAGANLYYMDFTDQLVKTGAKSDIGEDLTTNVADSYRMGVELTAGVRPVHWLNLEANAALSQNKIRDFQEMASVDWEDDFRPIHYDNTTIAFSPSVMLNGFADFIYRGFQATWHTGYVGRQYLDNTECRERSLDAYTRTDIQLSYTLPCCRRGLKQTILGLDFNNIFNAHYATSGWVYSSILTPASTGMSGELNRYTQIGYVPAAGFTLMGHITLRF